MYKYSVIFEDLKHKILNGEYRCREKLPSESELCRQYQVSRVTVRGALKKLQQQNLIVRKVGDATYVSYSPSASSARKKTVALVLTVCIGRLINAVRAELSRHQVDLSVYITEYSAAKEREVLLRVREAAVDGILCYPTLYEENLPLFTDLILSGFPICFLDRAPSPITCSAVFDNGYLNMFNLTERLIRMGYRSVGYASLPLYAFQPVIDRYNGFSDALAAHQIPIEHCNLAIPQTLALSYSRKDLCSTFSQLLHSKNRPEVVLCATGILAAELYLFAQSCGLKVPEDISIVAHDHCEISHLTSVIQDYDTIGSEAAKIVLNAMKASSPLATKLYVPGKFVEGRTLRTPSFKRPALSL